MTTRKTGATGTELSTTEMRYFLRCDSGSTKITTAFANQRSSTHFRRWEQIRLAFGTTFQSAKTSMGTGFTMSQTSTAMIREIPQSVTKHMTSSSSRSRNPATEQRVELAN